jgi:hypothetical protein
MKKEINYTQETNRQTGINVIDKTNRVGNKNVNIEEDTEDKVIVNNTVKEVVEEDTEDKVIVNNTVKEVVEEETEDKVIVNNTVKEVVEEYTEEKVIENIVKVIEKDIKNG